MSVNITIDGPSGSGKGITSKLLAEKINYNFLDSGAIYRSITYFFLEKNISYENKKDIRKYLDEKIIKIEFNKNNEVLLNDKNIENEIRNIFITKNVFHFSKNIEIRNFSTNIQKRILKNKGYILEGRDSGTIVCPNAELKIYLNCDINIRAKRRHKDFLKKGEKISLEKVKQDIEKRDKIDMNKGIYSLKKTKEMIEIDTTNISIEEQVEKIYKLYKKIVTF